MAQAKIEWICEHAGILRVFEDGQTPGADPYAFCCTVRRVDPRGVELQGVTSPPGRRFAWAIAVECARQGIVRLWEERHTGGRVRMVLHDLTRVGERRG